MLHIPCNTLGRFPGLASQRLCICLHHLLRMKYIDGSITTGNMADLVEAAVRSHPGLPQLLVRELVRLGENQAAAHWAVEYHLPTHTLPLDVQILVMTRAARYNDFAGTRMEEETNQLCVVL
jgi:hypothetical protein